MDVFNQRLLKIIETIKTIKEDIKLNTSMSASLDTEVTELQKQILELENNQTEYSDKIKEELNKNIKELQNIINSNIETIKKDISTEIKDNNKILDNYVKNEALELVINDLIDTVSDITLKEVKDGKNGIDGKNGKDGLNGKDGVDGKNGIDGKTPKFVEIETETVSSEEYADVEIERENDDYKIKFKIPKGKNGKNGKSGANGRDGIIDYRKVIAYAITL